MIAMVEVKELRSHESYKLGHAVDIAIDIKEHGILQPIIVDVRTYVVLDGHHRLAASRILGRERIPVKFVDLMDPLIVIEWRRTEFSDDTKETIIARALEGNPYPTKTTRIFKVDAKGNLRRLKEIV